MAFRTQSLMVASAMMSVALSEAEKGSAAPIAPTEIIHGTAQVFYDFYEVAYNGIERQVISSGIHHKAKDVHQKVKVHVQSVVTDDPLHHTCQKIGCKKKDIVDTWNKGFATAMDVKSQAYAHGTKVHDRLNDLTVQVATKLETHVPSSYKGAIPRKFWDFVLLKIYLLFVVCIIFYILKRVISMSLSVFCCVCCCCCRRRGGAATTTNGKKKKGAAAAPAAKPAAKKAAPVKAKAKN